MLRRGSSSRGARGASTTSRASSSRGRGRGASSTSPQTATASANSFEEDRLENAAKKEQRVQGRDVSNNRGGRGAPRGFHANKTVRFASPLSQVETATDGNPSPFSTQDPFSTASNGLPFGSSNTSVPSSTVVLNPFARSSSPPILSASSASGSPVFGAPASTGSSSVNPFRSQATAGITSTNPFGNHTTLPEPSTATSGSNVFGTSTTSPSTFSLFASSAPKSTSIFGAATNPSLTSTPFGVSRPRIDSPTSTPFHFSSTPSKGTEISAPVNWNAPVTISAPAVMLNGKSSAHSPPKSKLAREIGQVLRQHNIIAPSWPTSTPGDPRQKAAVEAFWQTTKAYRAKVRACLIRTGYLDDPDKPKKLSEAIDFKGTCEDMCPEFEKITRIMEHDVQHPEKESSPDGSTYWPSPRKMIKALARSAAGQDAPLPEDVRSPAALRMTLDYLVDTVLSDNALPAVHGFLWDRTRAIRRDFVFQQSSMNTDELSDQVYCLELITRFHVVALHQMSRTDIAAEDFSEQQEVEQLGKALLSLIHAYEDCNAQNIYCDNEAEFRSYYVLFNSHNPGILEAVQDWGWDFWGKSNDIRTAVALVESLQNIWDTHGPLKPQSSTEVALNAYHRFFVIVKDPQISYTMACFAEIHFNKVRKAAFKTILSSYRKQRDQTRDWTLTKLNVYLQFDDEQEVIRFGEAYALHFEELDGDECLSFDSDSSMIDPFPQMKQSFSVKLVERKRGHHSIADVIHRTVYSVAEAAEDEDDSLFVQDFDQRAPPQTDRPSLDPYGPLPEEDIPGQFSLERPTSMGQESQILQRIVFPETIPNPTSQGSLFPDRNSSFKPAVTESAAADQIPEILNPADDSNNPAAISSVFGQQPFTTTSSLFPILGQGPKEENNASSVLSSNGSLSTSRVDGDLGQATIGGQTLSVAPLIDRLGSSSSRIGAAPPAFIATVTAPAVPSQPDSDPNEPAQLMTDSSRIETSPKVPIVPSDGGTSGFANSYSLSIDASSSPETPSGPNSQLHAVADWIALSKGGLVDQFTESVVEMILTDAINDLIAEKEQEAAEDEERAVRQFRYRSLATKYGHMWRHNAHRLWMKRKGRKAREARRQMAESQRALKSTQLNDVVGHLNVSRAVPELDVERRLSASGVLNGVHRPDADVRRIVQADILTRQQLTPVKARHASQSPNEKRQNGSNHHRTQSDSSFRQSLLTDISYGGSRIHLMRNYNPKLESRRQPNGVQTDYFRLKARGIMTLPNGTPLASSAAVHLLNGKRSLDDFSRPETPPRPVRELVPRSVPESSTLKHFHSSNLSTGHDEDMKALKWRAKSTMAGDSEKRKQNQKRRMLDDDDEELFAKAKRIREQMDEGAQWFRAEVEKHSQSGSPS